MAIRLIAGLGNPGDEHAVTRHNAGFWFVDAVASAGLGGGACVWKNEPRFKGHLAKCPSPGIGSHSLWLLKPSTFMNRSGAAVQPLLQFYQIDPTEVLVVHDELDLLPGQIRLKQGGGHGGHNGVRDIANAVGSVDFWRLRIGIGHPRSLGPEQAVADFVLHRPNSADAQDIQAALSRCIDCLPELVLGKTDAAQRRLHTDPPSKTLPLKGT